MDAMRAAAMVALSLSLTAVAAAQNVDTAHRVCAAAGNAQPPVYLTMTSSGLSRLELSPSVRDGIAQIAVSREEIAALCAEGLDVRYRELGLLPAAFSIVRRRGAVYGNLQYRSRGVLVQRKPSLELNVRQADTVGWANVQHRTASNRRWLGRLRQRERRYRNRGATCGLYACATSTAHGDQRRRADGIDHFLSRVWRLQSLFLERRHRMVDRHR